MTSFSGIINGPLRELTKISDKIGGDVKSQCALLVAAFQAEESLLSQAASMSKPSDAQLLAVLEPCSCAIKKVTDFKDTHRRSEHFNNLAAVAESIAALGWVAVPSKPVEYIGEMTESGKFYSNRILKDFKDKDQTQVEWVHALIEVWTQLKHFTASNHPAGLTWGSGGGAAPSPGGPPPPPPPPPPPAQMPAPDSKGGDTQALFAEINRGGEVTRGLRKVTDDMKTHKNPELRGGAGATVAVCPPGPAAGASKAPPIPARPGQRKPAAPAPVLELRGNKWFVEHHDGNRAIVIEAQEKKETVYIYKCVDSVVQVKGKLNSIVMDSCKKTSLLFESVISSVDIVNCSSAQVQVTGSMPTVNIDKTDGCMVYLSKESKNTDIITAKSSEMNILVPKDDGEFAEYPLPEQFKTKFTGSGLETKVNDLS